MKLFIKILFAFIISLNLIAFASDIEVQPTMNSRSNIQDRVWTGTLQMAWSDFIFKHVHNPVRFREGTPIAVHELNKYVFSQYDISDKIYYKYSGIITKNTTKKISKTLKKKFNTKDIALDNVDIQKDKNNFLIYAISKKNFDFSNKFDRLGKSTFRKTLQAEYFGINPKTETDMRNNITVLFYNNSEDFAINIKPNEDDEIYIYKNPANKSFQNMYSEMKIKSGKYAGYKKFRISDELKIPDIKCNVSQNFINSTNKRIMGTNLIISNTIDTIDFSLTEKELKAKNTSHVNTPDNELLSQKPRYFYCNDAFIIFLKIQNQKIPYFALRVHDIGNYQ